MVELARRDLTTFWAALNVQGSPILVRDALLDFFPELIAAYGDAAALLAADFYDELRDVPASAARFTATLAAAPDSAQATAAARWGLGPLFTADPDPVQALLNLSGVAQRLVLQSGRDTISSAAFRDPVRTAYARVPTGPTTCKWCVMLASRGAIYANAKEAGEGNSYHGDCDCVPTPIRSKADYPEGHDVREFERLYAEGVGVGRDIPAET
ncbi:hypothetical protein [Cryobacterium sp. Y57]|uniref:VG15 protein n=1 Tax=Cryobacterium sp. Y57 TaxID=2048287 RepID=UPI001304F57F|nr:hypothetical protein [Cryobacterium sp. Y57]